MAISERKISKPTGFKQTEIGLIPEDWEIKKLSKVSNYQNGRALEKYFNSIEGLNVISIGNYSVDGNYIDTNTYIDWKYYEKIKKFILHDNELCMILNDKTSTGAIIGKVLLIRENNKYVFNQRSMRITLNDNIFPLYLYHAINSEFLHKNIVSLAKPGTQIYVNTGDITGLDIPIPRSFEEQQAIATALSDVDALITSLDKLIAKKRDIKQATMQELLTGKTRLPGFSGEWEVKTLEETIICLDNLRVPLNDEQRLKIKGDYPYCGANGILDYVNDYIIDDDIILIAEDGGYFDEYAYRPIAYKMIGKCWVNNHAHILKARENIDQNFVYYSLVHKNILRFLASGTRAKLNKSEMYKIEINTPKSKDEQQAIATILSDMDAEIVALEQKRAKTRALKQGMMQELLTGKTRLYEHSGPDRAHHAESSGQSLQHATEL